MGTLRPSFVLDKFCVQPPMLTTVIGAKILENRISVVEDEISTSQAIVALE